jgi:hypothetical protein
MRELPPPLMPFARALDATYEDDRLVELHVELARSATFAQRKAYSADPSGFPSTEPFGELLGRAPELCRAIVSGAPHLRSLDMRTWRHDEIGDAELAVLADLGDLCALRIGGCRRVGREGMQALARAHGLAKLRVDEPSAEATYALDALDWIEDLVLCRARGTPPFAILDGLRTLALYDCPEVTDAHLAELSPKAALAELRIVGCDGVSSEAARLFAASLESLGFHRRSLRDEDATNLGRLSALRRLELAPSDVLGDVGLGALSDLTMLEELTFGAYAATTTAIVSLVARLPRLERLDLTHLRIAEGDTGLADLVAPRLRTLKLHLGRRTPGRSTLSLLARLEQLEDLSLRCNRWLADDDVVHLRSASALATLDLGQCKRLTDAALEALTSLRLRALTIDACPAISDAGLARLAAITTLEELDAGWCPNVRGPLDWLVHLERLERLALPHTGIGDEAAAAIATLPELTHLDVSHTAITDAGLARLAQLPRLSELRVAGCRVTPAGLAALREHPSLRHLSVSGDLDAAFDLSRTMKHVRVSYAE